MKLRRSVLAILLLFSIIPLCIFGVFSLYEMNRKVDYMMERNLRVISENQIASIQKFADNRKTEMEKVANYELTKEAVRYSLGISNEMVDRKYLENLLREQKKYSAYVVSISVLDRNFSVVGSSEEYEYNETSELKNLDEKYHTGNFIIGHVYERYADDGLRSAVPAYIGVYDGAELIGYIAEELDTTYFDELRLNMDSISEGTFYLLDGKGEIITAGNTLQKDSLTHFETKTDERSDYHKKWEAIDHEENPSGEIYYKYNNQDYITYYSNVENTEWSIRVTENLSAQRADMKSSSVLFCMVLCVVVLGVVVVQTFITNKIMKPIQTAVSVFDEIKDTQNYSLRIRVNIKNEIGKLSGSINELLEYIEEEHIHEKITQRKLRVQADSDSLTGVKNKRAIEKSIMDMVRFAQEENTQITMGFVDIDNFRDFNTKYGHQVGDSVIKFVAETLQGNLHGEVGRIGGDEFVFCHVGIISQERIQEDVGKVLKYLNENYVDVQTNNHIPVTCSIGIVTTVNRKMDYTEMIRIADQAMYNAKEKGKNTFVIMSE